MDALVGKDVSQWPGGRREGRAWAGRHGRLRSPQGVPMDNPVMIENISSHGARLRTVRPWTPHESVDLADSAIGLLVTAEVVYCEPLADGQYAIGVKFDRCIEFGGAAEGGR
jgi:hypothetical protein